MNTGIPDVTLIPESVNTLKDIDSFNIIIILQNLLLSLEKQSSSVYTMIIHRRIFQKYI